MASMKVEVDRFDGKGDFGLWRQRMRAILVQLKIAKALEGEAKLPDSWSAEKKEEALELAYSTLILHLSDKVLREVTNEKSDAAVWLKLEHLYMTKTLTNRVYLKGKLFGFKMDEHKDLDVNLDDFAKIVIDLANIGVAIEEEDQAIMILNSLPSSYDHFVETMKYSRDTLSMEEVLAALKSKQIESKALSFEGEGLFVKEKMGTRSFTTRRVYNNLRFRNSVSPSRLVNSEK